MNFLRRFLAVACLFFVIPPALLSGATYGQIRALEERAVQVTELKNRFLVRILDSYGIPNVRNEQGMVVRIQVGDRWYDIRTVEIVPVTAPSGQEPAVTGHEVFFFTDEGVFHILTPMAAR
jgi:hypothetical protein